MFTSLSTSIETYLDADINSDDDRVKNAEKHILQMGSTAIPGLLDALRKNLREYRTRTMSNAQLSDMKEKLQEMIGSDMSQNLGDYFENIGNTENEDNPGISIMQRIVSSESIERVVLLITKLGANTDKQLSIFLNNPDTSLALTAAAVIFHLELPSQYIVKYIVTVPCFHLKLEVLPDQFRILFYALLYIIYHTGDKFAEDFLEGDTKSFGTDVESFSDYIQDMMVYFISIS